MFILATLAVIVVIGVLFIGNIRQNTRDAIVLPDTAQSVQSESQPDENKPALLEVTRENVQNIVRSLHRLWFGFRLRSFWRSCTFRLRLWCGKAHRSG